MDKFQALAVIPLSLVETRVRERERARISLEFLRCPRRYNPLVRRKLSLTTSCSFARSPPPPPPSYLLFIARQVIESAYFQKQRLFRSGVRQQREEQGKKEQLVFLSVLVVYIRSVTDTRKNLFLYTGYYKLLTKR